MQSLIRSKSAGVTGGRGTAGAGPGRDLLYQSRQKYPKIGQISGFLIFLDKIRVGGPLPPILGPWKPKNRSFLAKNPFFDFLNFGKKQLLKS